MSKPIIIFGSSRSNGNTYSAVSLIKESLKGPSFIDLSKYEVGDFDYEFKNKDDDFMQIIDQLLEHKTVILATPIYWYTMSATMKRFVDRLSDLLSINKEYGRLLREKYLAVISSYSIHPEGKDGFEQIFINISNYLGMNYLGCYFHYSGDNPTISAANMRRANEFINRINSIVHSELRANN